MIRKSYTCTLLTDAVLSATSANEGFYESLSYLPGAKFLGIVASELYPQTDDQVAQPSADALLAARRIFHEGKVRFGDAHLSIEGNISFPVPFAWHQNKALALEASPIYLYHQLTPADRRELATQDIRLKQVRNAYTTASGTLLELDQSFSIKSAYDSDTLSSKDGQMYGYFALPQGTLWRFHVDFDQEADVAAVEEALLGERSIGRSKSAQYGLVRIKEAGNGAHPGWESHDHEDPQAIALLYAASNLCFTDEWGTPTLHPTPQQLLLPEGSRILWEKSQIRTRVYRSWNQKRSARDADRPIIEKGSVIAVETPEPLAAATYLSGVGAYRQEGFGQVLLNPPFLAAKAGEGAPRLLGLRLQKVVSSDKGQLATHHDRDANADHELLAFLKHRVAMRQHDDDLGSLVNRFIETQHERYQGITPSQWGVLRKIAKTVANATSLHQMLFSDTGFFKTGQSKSAWQQKARAATLENYITQNNIPPEMRIDFVTKVAAEMPKSTPQAAVTS